MIPKLGGTQIVLKLLLLIRFWVWTSTFSESPDTMKSIYPTLGRIAWNKVLPYIIERSETNHSRAPGSKFDYNTSILWRYPFPILSCKQNPSHDHEVQEYSRFMLEIYLHHAHVDSEYKVYVQILDQKK